MTRIELSPVAAIPRSVDGVRPVNLRTDLRPLADLIELVFADSMDSYGRSAIREMRYLSHLGYGLNLIARLNDLALGISMGFVYEIKGKLVGNVSVYPANYPKDLGETWILANVGVHPDFQRQGIASALLDACLDMLRRQGAARAILQVNVDSEGARRLYERHGFQYERAWRIWRRSGFSRLPALNQRRFHITRPRPSEWKSELNLAQAARPNDLGGLGWLKPIHKSDFRIPLWRRALSLFSLNNIEKLIIRDDNGDKILASCWLQGAVGFGQLKAWLFIDPRIERGPCAAALLDNVVSRFERSTLVWEHPADDAAVNDLLADHKFKKQRELWHMRLDF